MSASSSLVRLETARQIRYLRLILSGQLAVTVSTDLSCESNTRNYRPWTLSTVSDNFVTSQLSLYYTINLTCCNFCWQFEQTSATSSQSGLVCFFLKTLQKLMNLVIYSNKMRYWTRLKDWKISRTWFYRFCLYEIFAKKQAGYDLPRGRLKDFWQKRRVNLTTSERKVFRDSIYLRIKRKMPSIALWNLIPDSYEIIDLTSFIMKLASPGERAASSPTFLVIAASDQKLVNIELSYSVTVWQRDSVTV